MELGKTDENLKLKYGWNNSQPYLFYPNFFLVHDYSTKFTILLPFTNFFTKGMFLLNMTLGTYVRK